MAEWLGVHARQVRKLAETGVIQRDGRGRYRLQVRSEPLQFTCGSRRPDGEGPLPVLGLTWSGSVRFWPDPSAKPRKCATAPFEAIC